MAAQNLELAERVALLTHFVSYKASSQKHATVDFPTWLARQPHGHGASCPATPQPHLPAAAGGGGSAQPTPQRPTPQRPQPQPQHTMPGTGPTVKARQVA